MVNYIVKLALNGKQVGVQKDYYENGKVATETTYKNSQQTGPAKIYDENGKLAVEFKFSKW